MLVCQRTKKAVPSTKLETFNKNKTKLKELEKESYLKNLKTILNRMKKIAFLGINNLLCLMNPKFILSSQKIVWLVIFLKLKLSPQCIKDRIS